MGHFFCWKSELVAKSSKHLNAKLRKSSRDRMIVERESGELEGK
jgi:hypothetical protein